MLNTIKFFSRYTDYILFDYKELKEIHEIYNKEVKEVLEFLEYLEKFTKPKDIYDYYFYPYFTKRAEYSFNYLNLADFLKYAVIEKNEFKLDITYELQIYIEI